MQYLLYILAIPFLYFNYKIIVSDIKNKIIPNKYLSYLLLLIPFYYIYIYLSFPEINYLLFLWQLILTFIISFILYYLWIWAAWDAKYLLVLSLFIPYIGIIPFIWNIALLTIIYLLLYFIWFYFWKCIFIKWYIKSLFIQIKIDLNEKWKIYKENKWWNTFFIILKWLVIFLLIFVSIRLVRIYLLNNLFKTWNTSRFQIFQNFIEEYNIYLILLFIVIFIWSIYWLKLIINKFKAYLVQQFKLDLNFIWNIFIIILFILLLIFIWYEYLIDPVKISHLLFLIFTLYLTIKIFFKILIYSYKITFWIAEVDYININNLKVWDIIDKEYLIKLFWNQVYLWAEWVNQNKKWILYPNPKQYFENIDKKINSENLKIILQSYNDINKYHKWKIKNFNENNTIKILKTFSFAPYILLWFIITLLYQNNIFKYIIIFLTKLFKNIIK